jgi:hypothetical protein
MASTFSALKFELIGTGDQAGNWGETTNENIGTAIEQAITGLGNPNFPTDGNLTITLTDTVALQAARALVLNVTSTGSLTATRELVVPTIQKQYIVQNNTTGGRDIIVKTAAGTGITVPNGEKALLYVDGVNVVSAVSYFSSLNLGTALSIANGGTGQTTRQEALDALAGSTTSGQYLRGNGTDVVMSAIQVADVPTLNQNTTGTAANVTGTVAVANGGTGATDAAGARTNLVAARSGANTDITSVALTTGTITTPPINNTDIVNKQYADAIASGIHFHEAVALATTTALPANTYNNGSSGVGATLTGNANGALSVDSTLTVVGERILVKNEAAGANNGVYVVTQVGSAGTPYILTRSTDMDSVGTGVDQIDEGDFFLVTSGTANVNTAWVQQTPPPITIGTTAIVFQQFSAPITYTAGTGLSESPSYTFNIANIGTAGTYGSASSVPVFTTNAQGQVTGVTNTAISIPNSATTATATNTANAIVARDASGNFSAGTITATLSGSATSATTATNLAGGAANRIAFQTGSGATGFVPAPTASGQNVTWNGSSIDWAAAAAGISYVAVTSNYTAANGEGVLTDTSGGSFTVTLPISPSTGAQVIVADAGNNWGVNNLTVGRNGSTIGGLAENLVCDISGVSVQFVYDGTTWELYAQIGANSGSGGGGSGITSGTAVASTSGTSISFTGIPSSTKQITVMLAGVSTSGTSQWLIQLGDSGGYETTGYISEAGFIGSGTGSTTQTAGFGIRSNTATTVMQGSVIISLLTSNTWVAQGMFTGSGAGAGFSYITSGSKTLTNTLDSIRLTTVNGTDTFDAGTINILYQ